jgi:LSM domain
MVATEALLSCCWASPCKCCSRHMQVTVELKNDLAISGTLHSVDQYLNIKLHNTQVHSLHRIA